MVYHDGKLIVTHMDMSESDTQVQWTEPQEIYSSVYDFETESWSEQEYIGMQDTDSLNDVIHAENHSTARDIPAIMLNCMSGTRFLLMDEAPETPDVDLYEQGWNDALRAAKSAIGDLENG